MNSKFKAYSDIELSTDVMTASGHRLIQLLLDKCLQQIELARAFIVGKDIPKKAAAVGKALDILEYLRICLNQDDPKARDLSQLLDKIYLYAHTNLLQANMDNDLVHLDHAKMVLIDIKAGWDGIAKDHA